jgi:glucose/arabinose dehydrogenase
MMIAPSLPHFLFSLISISLLFSASLSGSTLPSGFADERLAMGLDGTSIAWAPDGRIFVTQKKGIISIVKNGALLPAPFLDMQSNVDNYNERGLQSIVLDPNFHLNGYVYVYYAVKGHNRNRVSRFTASGDRAVKDSEVVLLNLDVITASIHNGGALFFKGGKLFVATGDGGTSNRAQSLSTLMGKVLRMNADGSIPQDNPFYTSLAGNFRLIYAMGFRNPFRAAVQRGTERVFINDVGTSSWEEVNELAEGKNYGWPLIEGVRTTQPLPANYQDPVYAYPHSEGCSVAGAAFYNPENPLFPSKYRGKYFFGDYCKGYIKVLDPDTGEVIETFATNIYRPISFTIASNGDFYYLSRGGLNGGSSTANTESCCAEVWRIRYTGSKAPTISAHPISVDATLGEEVVFVAAASGEAPLRYQWQRNRVDIAGATLSRYEISSVRSEDNGSRYRLIVSNTFGSAISNEATLTVSDDAGPIVQIVTPAEGFHYTAGEPLQFSGTATDAEDGTLPPQAYTWEIVFHHATHTHPAMPPTSGITGGAYPLSSSHEPAPDVWYRIYLTVKDADGNETTVFRDVHPVLADVTLTTNPAGLTLLLDGSLVTTPYTFNGVAGITRLIEAPASQPLGGVTYNFSNWSDGGAILHEISTPAISTTITATYRTEGASTGGLQAEVWAAISGTNISAIPLNSEPSSIRDLAVFEAPANIDDNYGTRIRGFIRPPVSGNYTFWISGNDRTELWLSTDGNAGNKKLIASAERYTNVRQWDKYATQKSSPIALQANQRYYIEALHKEGVGSDHVAVGWQLPDGTLERPIPGMRLLPFDDSGGGVATPTVTITNPEDGETFTAPASVNITAHASTSEGSIAKVEFYNGTTKLGQDATAPYSFSWNNVGEGSYSLSAKAIDQEGQSSTSSVQILVTGAEGCAGAGTIKREIWTGLPGKEISTIPLSSEPSSISVLASFEGPANIDDHYGTRIRGYICPPASGNYTFWISGNDRTELWLSTNMNAGNKRLIASAEGYTDARQWNKYASQRSSPIALQANQRYYIEALHKEGVGSDHIAVGWQLPDGTFERPIPGMRLIPYDGSGGSTATPIVSIASPDNGETFTAPASIGIVANASISGGSIVKVEFYNGSAKIGEDATSPYSYTWSKVSAGDYTLRAKAIGNNGTAATTSVNISVTSSACAGSGTILREVWNNVQYNDVASIPLDRSPDGITELTLFENPRNAGDQYGTRVRGYLCVPETGAYTFWISSNDHSELWLSTTREPDNKIRIAHITGHTNVLQWDKFPSQRSAAVNLVGGQQYYIEALHKEGVGSDHMAVGWQLPDGTLERPIPGSRLSPVESQAMVMNAFASDPVFIESQARTADNMMASEGLKTERELHIYPNPASKGVSTLMISGLEGMGDDESEGKIEIQRMTGEIVYSVKFTCGDCSDYSIGLKEDYSPGVYLVNVIANGRRASRRLFIK